MGINKLMNRGVTCWFITLPNLRDRSRRSGSDARRGLVMKAVDCSYG